jgi:hypothetical protein
MALSRTPALDLTVPKEGARAHSRALRALLLTGAMTLLVAGAVYLTPSTFALDDAYIALHSARVLVDGYDPAFHTPALTGATSPAYVALLAALLRLHIPDLVALRVATAFGLTAFLLAVWRLGLAVGLPSAQRVGLTIISVVAGFSWLHLTNGLETGWAMALLVLLMAMVLERRAVVAAVIAGVVPWLRPDLVPAVAVLLGVAVWQASSFRRRIAVLTVAALTGLPIVLWLWHDTGFWLPNSINAKRLFYAEHCLPTLHKLRFVLAGGMVWLLTVGPLSLGVLGLCRRVVGLLGVVAILATATAYALTFPSSVTHAGQRYLYPILLPWFLLGLAWLVSDLRTLRMRVAFWVAVCLTVALWPIYYRDGTATAAELRHTAEWIDSHVPPEAVVLVHDAGAVSVFAHRRLVDLVGLKTPDSIAAHAQYTGPTCGTDRAKAVAMIARRAGAAYFVAVSRWERDFRFRDGLVAEGFQVSTERTPVSGQPGYFVYRLVDSRATGPATQSFEPRPLAAHTTRARGDARCERCELAIRWSVDNLDAR